MGEPAETDKEMHEECTHMQELLKVQREVIRRHLDEHKWFQHITDKNEAVADFLDKFGWIMREMICGHFCEDRFKCKIAQQYMSPKSDPT
jgi:predicted HD phosphohydrolase